MVDAMYCYRGTSTDAVARNAFRAIKRQSDDILCNRRRYGNIRIVTIVAEYYFLRIGSTAGLTVTLCITDNKIDAYAAVSGAGQGLLNFGFGSYSSLLQLAENVLLSLDFKKKDERTLE